ncbi:uncharacterized protein STEHIDRAFT_169465 [Stereum hirsutum FP-91666 SS1]|uniref:uncharacterized protein n=1 Tax=Stereum hirsutum (strain FP-91666) TaxID=721885 RepID=UPI0004449367|nr:uncharacterized protein STEHIDRAFT_169465 [Stereum hirsutum FP-91666 SS1]EIM85589.1 hypothetical protein STEHIDRAFT_169465 [Stereum hirsutum FP-91666 SS1]
MIMMRSSNIPRFTPATRLIIPAPTTALMLMQLRVRMAASIPKRATSLTMRKVEKKATSLTKRKMEKKVTRLKGMVSMTRSRPPMMIPMESSLRPLEQPPGRDVLSWPFCE